MEKIFKNSPKKLEKIERAKDIPSSFTCKHLTRLKSSSAYREEGLDTPKNVVDRVIHERTHIRAHRRWTMRVRPTSSKSAGAIAMVLDLRKMSSLPANHTSHASEATSQIRADISRLENRSRLDASIFSIIFTTQVTRDGGQDSRSIPLAERSLDRRF